MTRSCNNGRKGGKTSLFNNGNRKDAVALILLNQFTLISLNEIQLLQSRGSLRVYVVAFFICSKVGKYVMVFLRFSRESRWCIALLIDVMILWAEKVVWFLSSSIL